MLLFVSRLHVSLIQNISFPACSGLLYRRIPLILLSIAAGTAVFIMLFFMAAHFVLSNPTEFPETPTLSPSMNVNREGVSTEEYQKLSIGMTYAQISAIIGGDGSLVESGENAYGKAYYIYGWKGETNQNAVVYITFVDDEKIKYQQNFHVGIIRIKESFNRNQRRQNTLVTYKSGIIREIFKLWKKQNRKF